VALLDDIANLITIAVDHTSVDPGDVVLAKIVAPVPPTSIGNSAFPLSVTWWVTKTNPNVSPLGIPTNATPPAALGAEYIAPGGLTGLSAAFAMMPPFVNANPAPAPTPYWIVARIVISWAADLTIGGVAAPAGTVAQKTVDKAIGPINANGLSLSDLTERVIGLFKIEIPAAPVEPGSPITARLRPKGAEDSAWDVDSASEIAPQYELAAKVQLEPLFRPLGRIINGVFGVGNQIVGNGAKIISSLVRGIAGVIGKIPGVGTPKVGRSVDRALDQLIRRLRIRDTTIFKGLELPIDANLLNRNFRKNLVPHNSTPPLPGPRSILPSVPTLESHLEVMDTLPLDLSLIPIAGNLTIPLAINNVVWELWDNPNPPAGNQLPNAKFATLDHTAGRNFKRTLAIEPDVADEVFYLRVRINCTINEDVANPGNAGLGAGPLIPGLVVDLPTIPLRLLGFNPLTFVTDQLQLSASIEQVELGEVVDFALESAIPLQSSSPTRLDTSFPLGALPLRALTVDLAWQVLDENGNPLVEGTDYALSGTRSDSRSVMFKPLIQIIRRENPAAVMRYVQVVLTSGVLPAETIGPIGVPVLPVLVPLFVAFLKHTFFGERDDDDMVQVLLPSFYVSHAPSWVESWDTFRERLNELQGRIGELLAAAAQTSAATPPAAGSLASFSGSVVERLTLLRGALDYVVNRPKTGKLEFLPGGYWEFVGEYSANRTDLSDGPMRRPGTIIVVNDNVTRFELAAVFEPTTPFHPNFTEKTLEVQGTQEDPVCILWPTPLQHGFYWINWIPTPLSQRWTNWVIVTCLSPYAYWQYTTFNRVRCTFDQAPGVNDYMPSPAAVWKAVPA
jgi:hypothetical protein